MNFIKKVFDEKVDVQTHIQFQRFSRGEFRNRALIQAKNSGGKYVINTSAEFANDFVRLMAEKLGTSKTNILGAVVSTSDLTGQLKFKDKKQFQGVKQYIIGNDKLGGEEMSGNEIISLLNKFPKAFFALSFGVGEYNLKIKAKAPKSGKPGSKGEEMPKVDFCKLITKDQKIVEEFIFEKQDFKTAEIKHNFLIDEIIIPGELKKSSDFAKIREESKRKGKIVRAAKIDEKEYKSEKTFEA